MGHETLERIEYMVSRFAAVIVILVGAQTLVSAMDNRWGDAWTFAAMSCIAVASRADVVRALMPGHPRIFVGVSLVCIAALLLAVEACSPTGAR